MATATTAYDPRISKTTIKPVVSFSSVGGWRPAYATSTKYFERYRATFEIFITDYYGKGEKLYVNISHFRDDSPVIDSTGRRVVTYTHRYPGSSDGNVKRIVEMARKYGINLREDGEIVAG